MSRFVFITLFLFASFAFHGRAVSQENAGFRNPILAGFYPDPSICNVDGDFYLVNSTFSYFPGIPVFHSRDLVNWELIGHVLDRPDQLNLDGQGVSRGIFAPSIRYSKGVFYVTCTLVDIGGNFVSTATSAEGPWSDPVWLPEINGIDPSPFFDDNGKAYIVYNSIAPDDKPLYDGHRTIRISGFDPKTLILAGKEKILVNGGTDLMKKPIWIEAPHIFKRDGYYVLIAAEGGTGDRHSEVVFRSAGIEGPYEPYERNPILTQRNLDPGRVHPITSTGHADFVQVPSGDWWAVFLGCRPYADDTYNTGRETFLAPVTWSDGWPVINAGHENVLYHCPYPIRPPVPTDRVYGGNLHVRDDFDGDSLNRNWMFLRTPHEKWYELTAKKGSLTMKLQPESCSGTMNPSFLGHRQQHQQCSASTLVDFQPSHANEKAGLIIFQNERHFYFFCSSLEGGRCVVQLYRSAGDGESMELLGSQPIGDSEKPIHLRIDCDGSTYAFSYTRDPASWTTLRDSVDAAFLSTKVAGGFVGCVFGLYATSLGKPTTAVVNFDFFDYRGDDEVYR